MLSDDNNDLIRDTEQRNIERSPPMKGRAFDDVRYAIERQGSRFLAKGLC